MQRFYVFLFVSMMTAVGWAQMKYQSPDKVISDLIDSPGFSYPFFNKQKTDYIRYRIQNTPPIDFIVRPDLRLAGIRLNADTLAQVSSSYYEDLAYVNAKTGKVRALNFPKGSYVQSLSWSPEGKSLAVIVEAAKCIELWLVSIPSLKKSKVPQLCLNGVFNEMGELRWLSEDKIFLNKRVNTKEVRVAKSIPEGPVVRESGGVVAQNRTYQDLLKTPQEAQAFENASLGQAVILNTKTLKTRALGIPGVYASFSLSPNREWMIATEIEKPFLYTVPFYFFKRTRWLMSLDGKVKKNLGSVGPFDNLPIEGVPTGPRNLEWDPTHPQRYIHVEALDGGDWKNKVPFRDQIVMNTVRGVRGDIQSEVIAQLQERFEGLSWLEDSQYGAIVQDFERDSKRVRYFQLKPNPSKKFELKEFFSRNENDDYNNPGNIYTDRNEYDRFAGVVQKTGAGDFIYWTGEGATPDGYRPFVKKMNLADFKMTEVFRSPLERFERFSQFMDRSFQKALFRTQSPTEPPQFEVRSENFAAPGVPLYTEPNPYGVMAQLKKRILKYKRKDGLELSGTLYYPLNYKEGQKYPVVVSAYPLEYTDLKSAGQTRAVANNYVVPFRTSNVYFALHGYAVLDNAQIPIVGHPETKNDTFVEQLVADSEATIKALDETGFVDTQRVGVVGHSYGAFMVSHLLTHTKFFAAGIARSGAYNRTLTPFGFQGERRPLWQAESTYLKLSSFLDADKMKFPMLLIHGMEDNNPGTFTLQSERYFDALKGQGAQARLVLLPGEMHGYASQESVKHVLWESFEWFDKHLKNKK